MPFFSSSRFLQFIKYVVMVITSCLMVVVVALDDVIIHLYKCICQVGCREKTVPRFVVCFVQIVHLCWCTHMDIISV